MPVKAVSLPFKEQSEFFRRKLNLPTEAWTDVYNKEHDWAFVVAGANRDAIVSDFRAAVEKVINEGATLADFRKDFDQIVAKNGWSYNGGRNWRSRVIYDTNLNSSYQAGRYQQLLAVKDDRPYWQYIHNDSVEHPRPDHLSWNGLILRWDNPWWAAHFPPNGWGCQCRVVALSDADLKRMGRTVSETPPSNFELKQIGTRSANGSRTVRVPKGIDPGFEYTPGKARLETAVPLPTPNSIARVGVPNTRVESELPKPQPLPESALLPNNLSATQYAESFLQEFGAAAEPAIFKDVVGEALVLGMHMFTASPVSDIAADEFSNLLAQALKSPDEVWVRLEWDDSEQKAMVKRRYIARFLIPGSSVPTFAVFEYGANGWAGYTAQHGIAVDDFRIGVRLYRRKE